MNNSTIPALTCAGQHRSRQASCDEPPNLNNCAFREDKRSRTLTDEHLTATPAELVRKWRAGPDRFMLGGRRWLPRWIFQPTNRLEDAFRLPGRLAPQEYSMGAAEKGGFWARVRVGGTAGNARDSSQPQAITFAIARAIGLEV